MSKLQNASCEEIDTIMEECFLVLLRKNNEGFEQKGQVVPPLVTWLNIIHAPHGFLPKQVSLVPVNAMNELNRYLYCINILNFIKNNI